MADQVPSASCVQAHTQQIANNRFLVAQDRLGALESELGLVHAQVALQSAEAAYDKAFSLGERIAAYTGAGNYIGYGAEAANFRAQLVQPRQQAVRDVAVTMARRLASAQEISRITDGIVARGPQRQGECTPVAPLPGLGPTSETPGVLPGPSTPIRLRGQREA